MLKSIAAGVCVAVFLAVVLAFAQTPAPPADAVYYDGAAWSLHGEGIVCCPCTTPCPCRYNAEPSYGHCEATLFLKIRRGLYGRVRLDGLEVADLGGMCSIHYQRMAALYFDAASSPAQREAFMKLLASMAPHHAQTFPYVRTVPFDVQITDNHLFKIVLPGILQMTVDRNWGRPDAPMPLIAAPDYFSNVIEYAENIRYVVHDRQANLDFDYSHRQANYRPVNLNVNQYRCGSMLVQHEDGTGWFNAAQMQLIERQGLNVAQPAIVRRKMLKLREGRLP